jgi:hypothetical protein
MRILVEWKKAGEFGLRTSTGQGIYPLSPPPEDATMLGQLNKKIKAIYRGCRIVIEWITNFPLRGR